MRQFMISSAPLSAALVCLCVRAHVCAHAHLSDIHLKGLIVF